MGYAAPIPGTGWTTAYFHAEQETLAAIERDTRRAIGILVFVVTGFGLAVWGLVHASLRPVNRLSAAARKLGSGDLSLRLPPGEVEEFEHLVEAFNRMAAQLEAAQRDLLEANRSLEHRVRQRTAELEQEHAKVLRAERLSTIGLFSSAIAHELRNPLNTVSLGIHWLKARLAAAPDERVHARLESIDRELRRSDQIIKTLLAFARTGEPERQPADLNRIVREVLDVVRPPEAVTVRAELDPDLPSVMIDPAQIFQVVENLIRNALQAMAEGGELRVATRHDAEACRLRISDTGAGIPPDLMPHIFEPLVTSKSSGTGLGLALCKRIVDAHGGQITVESGEKQGTTFCLELPLEVDPAPPARRPEPNPGRPAVSPGAR
jgi:signal transduction histidine kinase